MNKIPKYSLMLIFPNILYAAKNYARQIIKKRNFGENHFSSYKDTIPEKESYRSTAVLNRELIILSIGIAQYIHSTNIRKNKN